MSFFINVSWFFFSLFGLLVLKSSLLHGRRQHFGSRALRPSLFRIVNKLAEPAKEQLVSRLDYMFILSHFAAE